MSDLVGRKLGQYEIVAELGHGGMANVYRAAQASMGREVAIKVLPAHFLQDRSFLERFNREVKVIAKLQHPRILPVYDYGEADGLPYIVMAYLTGGTLADRLKQSGALPLGDAARLLRQMAEGLEYAHEQGIIHRDFKPSNVLLDAKGNAYLADFGIAKVTHDTAQLTGSGMVGTPAYMAPEMSRPGGLSPLIDVYALGVTLYQMVTGQQPYRADTPIGVMMAHATEPIPDARQSRADLPDGVQAVIERAMAKDPAARYATPAALADDYEAALAGAPLNALGQIDDGSTLRMPMESQHGMTTPAVPFAAREAAEPPDVSAATTVKDKPTVIAPIRVGGPRLAVIVGVVVGMLALAALVVFAIVPMAQNLAASSATPTASAGDESPSSIRVYNFAYSLEEHSGPISGLAFSPDNATLATASQDSTIKLWGAEDGSAIIQIASDRPMESVAFTPNGSLLLAAQFERVGVWDANTGDALEPFGGLAGNTLDAAIAPDGGHAVVGTADNKAVRWHPSGDADGEALTADLWGPVNAVAWSPASDRFAAGDDMGKLAIYAVEDLTVIRLIDVGQPILDLAYSPDGSQIASLSPDAIRVWSADDGAELRRMNSVPAGMRAIDWSPDGRWIAGGGETAALIVWDAQTGDPAQTIFQHEATVTAVAFSPDGARLASGDETGKAFVWQRVGIASGPPVTAPKGEFVVTYRQPLGSAINGPMRHAAFSASGARIVTGAESAVIVWDAANLVDNFVFDIGTPPRVPDVAFSPDGQFVVATVGDQVLAWNADDGSPAESLAGHTGNVVAVAIAPDGRVVASGGEDNKLILWSAETREAINEITFIPETVTAVAFSPDSALMAVGLSSGSIMLAKGDSAEYLADLSGHTSEIDALAFSPNGESLAAASSDGTISVWDVGARLKVSDFPGDGSVNYGVAFSPDGVALAVSTEQGNLLFWNMITGQPLGPGKVKASDSPAYDLDFAPDGRTLVVATEAGQALLFDVDWVEGEGEAPSAAVLPEGAAGQIAFVSDRDGNKEIYLLDLGDLSQTNLTNDPGADFSPAYAPDSARIAFVSDRLGEEYTDDLFLMDADGANPFALFPDERAVAYPTWSPDSQWIAYSSYVDDPGSYAVWKAQADGSQPTLVVDTPANDWVSDWTPDGVHIGFFADADEIAEQLFIVCECGGDTLFPLTSLADGDNRFPAWSPDGSLIAFESNRDGVWSIWLMNSDQTGSVKLAAGESPSWSPDGQFIVFSSDFETNNTELYLIRPDGSDLTRMTFTDSNNIEPEWRP